MKEIELLIEGLKKSYEEKKDELPTDAPYAWGELENRRRDIENFEELYNTRERIFSHSTEFLSSFTKRAIEIAEQIEKIKC